MAWYTEEEIIKALKMYIGGKSLQQVADAVGVTRESVRSWVKKAGIELRKEDAPMKRNWDNIREMLARIEEKVEKK